MIAGLKPYSSMKESGLPWLGKIPESWRVVRAKSVFGVIDVRSVSGSEELLTVSSNDGILPRSQKTVTMFKAESYVGHKLCWPGDLVINSLWAWMQGLGFSRYQGLVSSAYSVYRPKPAFTSYADYFHYALRSAAYKWELQTRSKGVWLSRLQLSDLAFLDMPIIVPPPDEQNTIVRFLNYADRRIRSYIRAKQNLIKLVEEQKRAIIYRAVTRGFDPNVRLKPSGVQWLGDVPEHWHIRRLKWVTRLQRGYDLPQDQRVPGEFPVISSGGVIGTHNEARAKAPGVVIGRYGSTEAVFFVESDFWPHNTALFVTNFQHNDTRWCYYLLRTVSKADYSGKSAVPGVDRKDLYEIVVPVPPLREQENVAHWLDIRLKKLDETLLRLKEQIELQREYRTCLITDVVTGKIDVRDASKGLPEEIHEVVTKTGSDELADENEESIESNIEEAAEEAEA